MKITLWLNLAVLLVNFFVAVGATETQTQLLRTTARVVYEAPLPVAAPVPQPPAGPPATVRLVKFLARLEELDRLTSEQVTALCVAHDACFRRLSQAGTELRSAALNGARAREVLGDLRARAARDVEATLRGAAVADGELRARLVRIVLASAG